MEKRASHDDCLQCAFAYRTSFPPETTSPKRSIQIRVPPGPPMTSTEDYLQLERVRCSVREWCAIQNKTTNSYVIEIAL
jgi:hypothetical protein